MLLGAIIARSSLSIYRSSHLTWLDCQPMRSDKPIRLLIHPYPPPLCINTLPPPLMYFDRSLSVLTSRHFWLWPSTAYLQNFPRGRYLLASLNQVDLSLNNTYFLLRPPLLRSPMLISNKLGNGNSQRDKTCRLLFSQDSFSAKLTSLPNGASCLCAATTAVFATAGCVCLSLLCFQELAVSSVYVLAAKMQKSAVTLIFASLFLSNCFYLCFLCVSLFSSPTEIIVLFCGFQYWHKHSDKYNYRQTVPCQNVNKAYLLLWGIEGVGVME